MTNAAQKQPEGKPQPAVTNAGVTVRRASRTDVVQLPELCRQLGYPSSESEIRLRFEANDAMPERALFVAETSGGKIVGLVDVFVLRTIESDPRAEIAGLVVDEKHRSRGAGELLMARAEEWAKEQHCVAVSLRTNVLRERAHTFYERLGYVHVKTQKSYRKSI